MQPHKIPFWQYVDNAGLYYNLGSFLDSLFTAVNNYEANYINGFRVKYSVEDINSHSFINTLLKVLRVPKADRLTLGDFNGVDWGYDVELDEKLFTRRSKIQPGLNLIQFD